MVVETTTSETTATTTTTKKNTTTANNNDNDNNNGLIIVYTGGGKGKTTAALGMALRALGHNMRVCMVQFIKGSWTYGEMSSSKLLEPDFEMTAAGRGFVGIMDDKSPRDDHKKIAKEAVRLASDKIGSGKYDIVILDEINYAIDLGLVQVADILDIITNRRPHHVSVVLTGNRAKNEIIDVADMVTEMREIKHPFKKGIRAKKGIDF